MMIPTMLIPGLAVGFLPHRWAILGIVLLAIGWTIVLLATDVVIDAGDAVGALAGQATAPRS